MNSTQLREAITTKRADAWVKRGLGACALGVAFTVALVGGVESFHTTSQALANADVIIPVVAGTVGGALGAIGAHALSSAGAAEAEANVYLARLLNEEANNQA